MLTPEQEYYARVCERDYLWDAFCDLPSENNWQRYQEACRAVNAAEQSFAPDGATVAPAEVMEDGISAAGHGYGE